MKQMNANKYNIAWFKLAECISRGEKERALGVYRLLSHSIDDPALKIQLEGDILLSFDDESAMEKYRGAVELYKQHGQLLQAAAVLEHLVTIFPEKMSYQIELLDLYSQLGIAAKVDFHANEVFDKACKSRDWGQLKAFFDAIDLLLSAQQAHTFREQLIFDSTGLKKGDELFAQSITKKVVDHLIKRNSKTDLQQFLAKLKEVDKDLHAFAVAHIEYDDK